MHALFSDFMNISESNIIVESDPNACEIIDGKTKLELRNKLGAKILKAKLQGKMVCPLKITLYLHLDIFNQIWYLGNFQKIRCYSKKRYKNFAECSRKAGERVGCSKR